MAIGKVNAYATVDAPKADFGAVAQMNIDNLVKSVKEDEQAKAVKAAAAEKIKEERRKSKVDFPTFVPTGGVALDSHNYKEAKDSQEKYIEDVRLWEETGDTEAKTRADKAVAYQKNINAELTRFSDVVKNTGKLMGEDKVNSKQKEHIQEILNAQANGEFILRRDHNTGEVYGAVYKKTDDPSKMEFVKEVNMKDFYGDVSNPVPNIEISKEQEVDQNLFEKTLTETSLSALKETGIKALSPEALASLDKKASERMGDDNFMYVYASAKNIPLEGDKYKRTFTDGERKIASEMYAKELKSMFGKETTIERRLGNAPTGGRGGDKEDKTLTIDTTSSIIKADENNISTPKRPLGSGSTYIADDTYRKGAKTVSIPIGTRTYQVTPIGGKDIMSNSLGMKLTGVSVFPDGTFAIRGEKISKSLNKATYGPETESESVGESKKEIIISSRTKGSDYNSGIAMIIQRGGSAIAKNGKTYNFNSRQNIEAYAKANYESETGKPFPKRKATSTGTRAKAKAGAKKETSSKPTKNMG